MWAQQNLCPQTLQAKPYNHDIQKPIHAGVMTYAQALSYFNFVQKKEHGIPYKYVIDGCDMRALLISKMLKEKFNIQTFRVALETKGENLYRKTPYVFEGEVEFNRHTAPGLCVKNPKTNIVEPYIFDPSFFNQPVPLSVWRKGFDNNGKIPTNLFLGNMYSLDPKSTRTSFSRAELRETERLRSGFMSIENRINKTGKKPYGIGNSKGKFEEDFIAY